MITSRGVLFHDIELSGAKEFNEIVLKRVYQSLNPKRKVLGLTCKVDFYS